MSDPFDISKALEGAVKDTLSPEASRFKIHSEHFSIGRVLKITGFLNLEAMAEQ